MAQSESSERKWIWLFCLLAAVHVFIFSAAFPFFNNVDENIHFDLLVKYSHGMIPRTLEPISGETLDYVAAHGSPEYRCVTNVPPQTTTVETTASFRLMGKFAAEKNYESAQPPLYYVLTGMCWHLGKACGLHDRLLLYSIRFLNILFVTALVWLGSLTAQTIFPGRIFVRLGVPALIAFMPQTAFYSIQNDVLSPVCFGVAFICLVRFLWLDQPDLRLGIVTGLALAATGLAKLSNLPLLVVSVLALLWKTWQLFRAGKLRAWLPMLASLAVCAGLPLALWCIWCRQNFGDFTGSEMKIHYLGWTHKPFSEWWHHPIFTASGLWLFASQLMVTFWQGEIIWHTRSLNFPVVNAIYTVLSCSFVGLAIHGLFSRTSVVTRPQRQALWLGLGSLVAAAAFLGFLSIIYDFQLCLGPSREGPYFTSGRLLLGALIPFLLLFLFGLDHLLESVKRDWTRLLVLAGLILFMLVSEIVTDWPVFSSQYNWFHM
jgi:Predicted membrane protein (DUF2142)